MAEIPLSLGEKTFIIHGVDVSIFNSVYVHVQLFLMILCMLF